MTRRRLAPATQPLAPKLLQACHQVWALVAQPTLVPLARLLVGTVRRNSKGVCPLTGREIPSSHAYTPTNIHVAALHNHPLPASQSDDFCHPCGRALIFPFLSRRHGSGSGRFFVAGKMKVSSTLTVTPLKCKAERGAGVLSTQMQPERCSATGEALLAQICLSKHAKRPILRSVRMEKLLSWQVLIIDDDDEKIAMTGKIAREFDDLVSPCVQCRCTPFTVVPLTPRS